MSEVAKIRVSYCSNYNGANFWVYDANGNDIEQEHQAKVDECTNKIVEQAGDDCDCEGGYHGDIDALEDFAKKTVHEAFGEHVEVTFEEDNIST